MPRKSFSSANGDESPVSFTSFISLLQAPAKKRSPRSIQRFIHFLKTIKFFEKVASDLGDSALTMCCLCMTYQYCRSGEYVIRQGEMGDKFFILLEGSCTVEVTLPGHEQVLPVAYYSKGDYFGELALLQNRPRAASILCTQNSHFGVLGKDDYTQILANLHEEIINKKADFLQSLPMFANWGRNSLQKLGYYFKEVKLVRKQVLFRAGDRVENAYFVKEGEIQLVQEVKLPGRNTHFSKHQKATAEITLLGKGEWVGCEAFLQSERYLHSSVCSSDTAEVLSVAKDDFMKRANTEDTLRAIWQVVRVKEEMRKGQVENGKLVRLSDNYTANKGHIPTISSPEIPVIRDKKPEIEVYPRLYPFKDPMREVSTSQTLNSSRGKTWDTLIRLKSTQKKRISQLKPHIVNIHTHSQRRFPTAKQKIASLSMSSSSESQFQCSGLTINSVERTGKEEEFSKLMTNRSENRLYSEFRMKKSPNLLSF